MHFRILKTIGTCAFLTAPECTKFVFGRGSPQTLPEELSIQRSTRPPSWFKGVVLLREGREREGLRDGEGKLEKGRAGKDIRNSHQILPIPWRGRHMGWPVAAWGAAAHGVQGRRPGRRSGGLRSWSSLQTLFRFLPQKRSKLENFTQFTSWF